MGPVATSDQKYTDFRGRKEPLLQQCLYVFIHIRILHLVLVFRFCACICDCCVCFYFVFTTVQSEGWDVFVLVLYLQL